MFFSKCTLTWLGTYEVVDLLDMLFSQRSHRLHEYENIQAFIVYRYMYIWYDLEATKYAIVHGDNYTYGWIPNESQSETIWIK